LWWGCPSANASVVLDQGGEIRQKGSFKRPTTGSAADERLVDCITNALKEDPHLSSKTIGKALNIGSTKVRPKHELDPPRSELALLLRSPSFVPIFRHRTRHEMPRLQALSDERKLTDVDSKSANTPTSRQFCRPRDSSHGTQIERRHREAGHSL
jgi:hypothetical protein